MKTQKEQRQDETSKIEDPFCRGVKYFVSGVIGGAIGLCLGATTILAQYSNEEGKVKDRAYGDAMSQYEPVGNGGALSALSGRVSSQRQEMYGKMLKAYEDSTTQSALEGIFDWEHLKMKWLSQGHSPDDFAR